MAEEQMTELKRLIAETENLIAKVKKFQANGDNVFLCGQLAPTCTALAIRSLEDTKAWLMTEKDAQEKEG